MLYAMYFKFIKYSSPQLDHLRRNEVAEELKACDQMAWAGLMDMCRAQIEEIIMEELIAKSRKCPALHKGTEHFYHLAANIILHISCFSGNLQYNQSTP